MSAQTFFGYKCPRCNSTIDVGASVTVGGRPQDKPTCPSCGVDMVPNPEGRTVAMNVHCRKCNSMFGMINSDVCPSCGEPFA